MSGGGKQKRFNVWIVYSDLFSNLATFLFFSAAGMFAAFGAGSTRSNNVSPFYCNDAVSHVATLLTGKLAQSVRTAGGCTNYVAVGRFTFANSDAKQLSASGHTQDAEEQFRRSVCEAAWKLVRNNDFQKNHGRLLFAVSAAPSEEWKQTTTCERAAELEDKRYQIINFERHRPPGVIIQSCEREHNTTSSECLDERACLAGGVGSGMLNQCNQIVDVDQDYKTAVDSCVIGKAELQAATLYDTCSKAWRHDRVFVDDMVRSPEYGRVRPEDQIRLWRQVSHEAERTGPGETIIKQAPGSVFLVLKFGPAP